MTKKLNSNKLNIEKSQIIKFIIDIESKHLRQMGINIVNYHHVTFYMYAECFVCIIEDTFLPTTVAM